MKRKLKKKELEKVSGGYKPHFRPAFCPPQKTDTKIGYPPIPDIPNSEQLGDTPEGLPLPK